MTSLLARLTELEARQAKHFDHEGFPVDRHSDAAMFVQIEDYHALYRMLPEIKLALQRQEQRDGEK